MPLSLAIAGFRHLHILDVYNRAKENPEIEVVASCEEDPQTRDNLASKGISNINYSNISEMLDSVDCDIIAVGDYYSKRGSIIIDALKRGKHVVSDKPICISLDEYRQISDLCKSKGLQVGCQLDLKDAAQFIKTRELILEGTIGEIHAIVFGGQHPLMIGTRPSWYFEEGKHGGTINDIGIHAFDYLEWATGMHFSTLNSARSWNAFAKDYPYMHDAGQCMLTMENGCGVIGDVSYFMPDSFAYSLDQYWRMTFFGKDGIIETSYNTPHVLLAKNGFSQVDKIPAGSGNPGGYFTSFLDSISECSGKISLNTQKVLRASEITLKIQDAANTGATGISLT